MLKYKKLQMKYSLKIQILSDKMKIEETIQSMKMNSIKYKLKKL